MIGYRSGQRRLGSSRLYAINCVHGYKKCEILKLLYLRNLLKFQGDKYRVTAKESFGGGNY